MCKKRGHAAYQGLIPLSQAKANANSEQSCHLRPWVSSVARKEFFNSSLNLDGDVHEQVSVGGKK